MKMQAHLPAVSIGAREWRATIAMSFVAGALLLILAVQSGVLTNDSLLDRWEGSPDTDYHVHSGNSSLGRVSLNVHSTDQADGFSVAHALPGNVAWSQRFSIGGDDRAAFEGFGETALREMLGNERTERRLKPGHDRLMLMLMLLRLREDRRG